MPMDDEIYDTSIYINYEDLTDERRQELYREFLQTSSEEKRLAKLFFILPLAFSCVLAALFLTAIIYSIVKGIGIFTVIIMITLAVVLVCFIVANMLIDKTKKLHQLRYKTWLKTEKRILLTLKGE